MTLNPLHFTEQVLGDFRRYQVPAFPLANERLSGKLRAQKLWGANYYPGRGRDGCVEFTSFVNIRPARGNPGMEIADPGMRERVRELALELIGEGGSL